MVPRSLLTLCSIFLVLIVAVLVAQVAQASDEDFETWNLAEYEPYEKRSGQVGLSDMLMPYDKRGKTKFVRKCLAEGKVCTCDMRFSSSSGRRYIDCRKGLGRRQNRYSRWL